MKDLLRIIVDEHITTGHHWELFNRVPINERVVDLSDEEHVKSDEASEEEQKMKGKHHGRKGARVFTFKPIKEGKETLRLVYSRHWERPHATTKDGEIDQKAAKDKGIYIVEEDVHVEVTA